MTFAHPACARQRPRHAAPARHIGERIEPPRDKLRRRIREAVGGERPRRVNRHVRHSVEVLRLDEILNLSLRAFHAQEF